LRIAGIYSFNNGVKTVESKYPELLKEVRHCIQTVNASLCKTKKSEEKTMPGEILYSPVDLNSEFKKIFFQHGWRSIRVRCEYPTQFYVAEYSPVKLRGGAFREMDFIKEKLGVEVQFGKYSFMVYNVAAKMTIFRNLSFIDTGIEIVPVKALADGMSTGVSYYEQFLWDLEHRGVSNIDIPVMIIGVDA